MHHCKRMDDATNIEVHMYDVTCTFLTQHKWTTVSMHLCIPAAHILVAFMLSMHHRCNKRWDENKKKRKKN